MKRKTKAILILSISWILTVLSFEASCGDMESNAALPYSPKEYVCFRTDNPITIDGKIDESSWKAAQWSDPFIDIEGPTKPNPPFKTQVKMLWDNEYFYIAADMEEPHLWATLTNRDSVIFQDNDFEVFIDPDGDTHNYFEFEVNALNTIWDLFLTRPYRDKTNVLNNWDIKGLKSSIHLRGTLNDPSDVDQGWSVEIAFPWAAFKESSPKRSAPEAGDNWRVNFSRVQWRIEAKDGRYSKVIDPKTSKRYPENNWVWSPQGRISMHMPERWGYVYFSGQGVGNGTERFQRPPEENAKWALRLLYYAQKERSKNGQAYTNDIEELSLRSLQVEGYRWPPEIRSSLNLYEAQLTGDDGSIHYITQDGKVGRSNE